MKRNLLVLFGLAFAACGGGKPAPTVPPTALGEEAVPPETDQPVAPSETAPIAKGNPRDDFGLSFALFNFGANRDTARDGTIDLHAIAIDQVAPDDPNLP